MKTITLLLLLAFITANAQNIEQPCQGNDCVQVGKNMGIINIEGGKVQIGINNGSVNITYVGDPKDKAKIKNYDIRMKNLSKQIERYLVAVKEQVKRRLTSQEQLIKVTEYAQGLVKQLDELSQRNAMIDELHDLNSKIKVAQDNFDIPLLKQLLKKKELVENQQTKSAAATVYQLARFEERDLEYAEAYNHFQKAVYFDSLNPVYLTAAGRISNTLAKCEEAIALFEKALVIDLETYGKDDPNVINELKNLGMAWDSFGDHKKAIEYLEMALASDLKTYGEGNSKVAYDRNCLGTAWAGCGYFKKAIWYLEMALNSDLKNFGEEDSNVAYDRNNLGTTWADSGDYEKAIKYYELVLVSFAKIYGEGHPLVALARSNLGGAYNYRGDHKKAREYLEIALANDIKTFGEWHPAVARDRAVLGETWAFLRDYKKAIGYLELTLASDLKTYGICSSEVANDQLTLGTVWKVSGNYKKAIEYYEPALVTCNKVLGKDDPETIKVLENMNDARARMAQEKR
jgi:tetratricopeptide (TPR) repeat protein